jgi:hypothetical protein
METLFMAIDNPKYFRLIATLCVFSLLGPVTVQAASDDELSEVRAQLLALSERLDRLEAENHSLKSANAELTRSNQLKAVTIADVSEKTEAVEAVVEQQKQKENWTERMRWQGDFRYRYEAFNIEGEPNRDRNRIRARAALIADVTPTIEVGLGLASGGEDPVSSNQTLGGGGSSKGLNIDLAYFDWSGLTGTHLLGGKFKNYLVDSGSNALLWDSDWRPEGFGVFWANDIFFVNGLGTWVESDSKAGQSFAYATQAGINMEVGNNVQLVAGVGYYVFDTKGLESFFGDDDDFFGNSFNPVSNTYLYDYEELEVFAGLVFDLWDRPLLTFGTYVQNQAVDENDTAWSVGFKYGKTSNRHDWDVGYMYKHLEADAAFGLLVDSDFGGGGTNAKGHVIKGSYGLAKNLAAKLTYFINDVGIRPGEEQTDFNRLQLDLSFKYK